MFSGMSPEVNNEPVYGGDYGTAMSCSYSTVSSMEVRPPHLATGMKLTIIEDNTNSRSTGKGCMHYFAFKIDYRFIVRPSSVRSELTAFFHWIPIPICQNCLCDKQPNCEDRSTLCKLIFFYSN